MSDLENAKSGKEKNTDLSEHDKTDHKKDNTNDTCTDKNDDGTKENNSNVKIPQTEIEMALSFFRVGQVGGVNSYHSPLSKQIRLDTADYFPIDKKYFLSAEKTQKEVLGLYFLMRLGTLALFAVMTAIQAVIYRSSVGRFPVDNDTDPVGFGLLDAIFTLSNSISSGAPSAIQASIGIGAIVIVGVLFFLVRLVVRGLVLHFMCMGAERLSFKIFTRLDIINTRITETCAKARDRVGDGEWSQRARKWIICALWNARRSEYLDRYITVTIWTVRTYIGQMEWIFLFVEMVIVVAVSHWLFQQFMQGEPTGIPGLFIFSAALLAQTYFLWYRAGRQPGNFWTMRFRRSAPKKTNLKGETYADKISGVVENLVDEVISKEFGQGGQKP